LDSWHCFDGSEAGKQLVQLQLRLQAAQQSHTALQHSTRESKTCMKALHGAIGSQQRELGKIEALQKGLISCTIAHSFEMRSCRHHVCKTEFACSGP
jgi:hypothetical protein